MKIRPVFFHTDGQTETDRQATLIVAFR